MMLKKLVLVSVIILMLSPGAWAGTKATPDNCAAVGSAVGSAVVHCYDCVNSKYLGKVSVLTGYEESGGEGYCVVASEAKAACSRVFGFDRNGIGYYTEFRIGGGSRDETYDTSCVKRVGKP